MKGDERMTEEPREIRIETPEGEVVAHESPVEDTPQTISAVLGDELEWLQSLGEFGPQFVAHYVPTVTEPDLQDYDAAFHAWQSDSEPPFTDEQVIQILGGYLGNRCIADFDMEWVTVTDEYGTDYAIRSTEVEVMSFPFDTVLKRIEEGEHAFVHGVYYTLKDVLASGDYKARERPQ